MASTLLNVSNRLPVTVGPDSIRKSSGGLVAALEGLPKEKYTAVWIGWPGAAFPDPERQRAVERTLTEEHGCVPVFLSEEEAAGHYEGFSNSSIWPLLHYLPNYLRYEEAWWDQYQVVNRRFAEVVLRRAKHGDTVWVHDYQLMLLPALLKAEAPHLRVGFFLHTPFPAYELFRFHPRRRELATGMLGADRIGFHTFGYLRHFSGTVQRLLDIDSEVTRVSTAEHTSALGVYPIGINAAKFLETLASPEFAERRREFGASHQGKRIVLSVERLDYTKGILHRLEAIDRFLTDHNEAGDVRFVFVSVPSREGIEEYQTLREEVESQVGRINGKHATLSDTPIHFIHGSVPFTDLCAVYALADVALVTPLIDGMNLVAKEYLACQEDDAGVLILSEFAGAAEELSTAVLVNPYDARGVAEAIAHALTSPPDERRAGNHAMRERLLRRDAQFWARSFLDDLSSDLPSETASGEADVSGARERIRETVGRSEPLALFLDYDGTLREIERDPAAAGPTPEIRNLLERLSGKGSQVRTTVVSGRNREDLSRWLGDLPVALVAEHGACRRLAGQADWEELDRNVNYGWMSEVLKILRMHEEATPGSFVEEKRSALVWHYRQADPEFGSWRAHQLAEELGALTANEPIQVRHGKKIVEVSASEVSKGGAVSSLLAEQADYGLAVCAGDDATDETMFRLGLPRLLTIKVGAGHTAASVRLTSPAAFRRFLEEAVLGGNGRAKT